MGGELTTRHKLRRAALEKWLQTSLPGRVFQPGIEPCLAVLLAKAAAEL